MNYKILITLLLLFVSQTLLAEVTVKVDRDPVVVDESFHIIFESDQQIDADPDFSPLSAMFTILNSSRRSNTQIINGKVSHSQMWILTLIPNKAGRLNIPAIKFGNELTKPSSINVIAAAPPAKGKKTDDVFIEIEVNTKMPYVQAQLIYTVKLFRSVATNNASLSEPELSGGQAVINKIGEDSSYETQHNGKRYVVIQRQYVIFPQSSGVLRIEPIIFQGQVGGAGGFFSFDPYGPQPKSIIKRSEAVELHVKPIPDSFTGDTWLPANQLMIQEQWSVDPSRLEQGEATTRTLTLMANGLAASNLPSIKSYLPDALKEYPDQPEFEESNNADGYIGTRRDKMAIIPTEPGDYTLPAIKIPWWNIAADKMEVAELPERTIHVEANAAIAANKVNEQSLTPDLVASVEPDNNEQRQTMNTAAVNDEPIWKWASAVLFVLWLLTLFLFWKSKQHVEVISDKAEQKLSSRKYLRQLHHACKDNNPAATRQALLQWANSMWPDKQVNSLDAIKALCDEDFTKQLEELNSCLYGNKTGTWDGKAFLNSFESQKFETNQTVRVNSKLEPLYKS